uniref:Type I polyketide synthase n=1 Tax=Gambierdiscus excentricus TaxID=986170 RepID=A0A1S6K895_9DINO|nr:type I polyketide synthase [Gambierdiscus excentricus]
MAEGGELARPPDGADYDVNWATTLSSQVLAKAVAETIFAKGHCVIQMSEPEDQWDSAMEAVGSRTDWTLPKPEFEEAYLGRGARSQVVWLSDSDVARPTETGPNPLWHYTQCIKTLGYILINAVPDILCFTPGTRISGLLMRTPLEDSDDFLLSSQEPLSEEEVRAGWVEKHLDFVQRRRLCMMYLAGSSSGIVELHPKPGLGEEAIALSLAKGKLLVFRHDLMSYSYFPNSTDNLAFQAWFMEEPQLLSLGSLEGDQASLEAVFGGPPQPPDEQVHIMSGMCRFPGRANRLQGHWAMLCQQTDTFREIPLLRWDMSLYFTSESGQFATAGKSVQKHSGLLEEKELMQFDNTFFNIEARAAAAMAPAHRLLLETSFELLFLTGYTRKSLVGCPLHVYCGSVDIDWEQFRGYDDKEGWLKAGSTVGGVGSANHICYRLGLRGPATNVDTACSASLVSANLLHAAVKKTLHSGEFSTGMSIGFNTILSPWPYIGMSAAGMVGRAGRCMTFNESANGFARGEGCGGLTVKTSTELEATQNRLGCYMSSYVNQDGRSASLTAPNGPSQQACIRGSLLSADLVPSDLLQTENHGTGTALGDPIETGSIARVFQKFPTLLPVTSCKTLTGHLECSAGSVSLLKTLMSLLHSTVTSNNHLRVLNSHMVDEGFPGVYPNATIEIPGQHNVIGMNAFGFGGTNSRAEVWAQGRNVRSPKEIVSRGLRGLRVDFLGPGALLPKELQRLDCVAVTCPRCGGEMCWLCSAALVGRTGKHHCVAVREEFASYELCSDCYAGGFQVQAIVAEEEQAAVYGQRVYLASTCNAWSDYEEMEEMRSGLYVGSLTLGDLGVERFHLVVDRDPDRAIVPPAAGAGRAGRAAGPRRAAGRSWLVDGRMDGAPPGTVYEVSFEWTGTVQRVSWRATTRMREANQHNYSLARRSKDWKPEAMTRSAEEPDLWEWQGALADSGPTELEFHVLRDGDTAQALYPLRARAADDEVPVMGPDEGGRERGWLLQVPTGQVPTVSLRIQRGEVTVSAGVKAPEQAASLGHLSIWRNLAQGPRNIYFLVGSWGGFQLSIMTPDESDPAVHRCRFSIGPGCQEEFHVVANASASLSLFPPYGRAQPGESLLCGPGENKDGFMWAVHGVCGQLMEATLNFSAEDCRSMLSCCPCEA